VPGFPVLPGFAGVPPFPNRPGLPAVEPLLAVEPGLLVVPGRAVVEGLAAVPVLADVVPGLDTPVFWPVVVLWPGVVVWLAAAGCAGAALGAAGLGAAGLGAGALGFFWPQARDGTARIRKNSKKICSLLLGLIKEFIATSRRSELSIHMVTSLVKTLLTPLPAWETSSTSFERERSGRLRIPHKGGDGNLAPGKRASQEKFPTRDRGLLAADAQVQSGHTGFGSLVIGIEVQDNVEFAAAVFVISSPGVRFGFF